MDEENSKRLTLVRGMPGAGRTTLARMLAGDHGYLLAPEEDLDRTWSPINPEAMTEADSEGILHLIRVMGHGERHIVMERVFHRFYTMRPFVEIGTREGYQIEFQEPNTDWVHDPRSCHARTRKPVAFEELVQVERSWEKHPTVDNVIASRTPTERFSDAITLLAQIHLLRSANMTSDPSYAAHASKLQANYAGELRHLEHLGFMDGRRAERVGMEYAAQLSSLVLSREVEDEAVTVSPAAVTTALRGDLSPTPANPERGPSLD